MNHTASSQQLQQSDQSILDAHERQQKEGLLVDMRRLFWRDHPQATQDEYVAWLNVTCKEIGLA